MADPQVKALAQILAPYRSLRLWIYGVAGTSGVIGGLIFLLQALAGRHLATTLPNLALQVGIVSLCAWLWRWEKQRQARQEERIAQKLAQKRARQS
ncbi:MAG: DUF3493 domain-containing protein [Thermostichales cyanobacterium SZTDM-1c_bins_54]